MQGRFALIDDLIHSCAHGDVAMAALKSLGRAETARVSAFASDACLPTGQFVSQEVRLFVVSAGSTDWGALRGIMERSEMPLLEGLRFILASRAHIDRADRTESGSGFSFRPSRTTREGMCVRH